MSVQITNAPGSGSGHNPVYFNGYVDNTSFWSTSSATFTAATPQGASPTLNTRVSSGITVTQAAGDLPGITFTPASNTAAYIISVSSSLFSDLSTGGRCDAQLGDGTVVICEAEGQSIVQASPSRAVIFTLSMQGVYVPGTTSPVTVAIQLAAPSGGNTLLGDNALANSLEWSLTQI